MEKKYWIILLILLVAGGLLFWGLQSGEKKISSYEIEGTVAGVDGTFVRFTINRVLADGREEERSYPGQRFVSVDENTQFFRVVMVDGEVTYEPASLSDLARFAEVTIHTRQDLRGGELLVADRIDIGQR